MSLLQDCCVCCAETCPMDPSYCCTLLPRIKIPQYLTIHGTRAATLPLTPSLCISPDFDLPSSEPVLPLHPKPWGPRTRHHCRCYSWPVLLYTTLPEHRFIAVRQRAQDRLPGLSAYAWASGIDATTAVSARVPTLHALWQFHVPLNNSSY